jgi:hypothetical protein
MPSCAAVTPRARTTSSIDRRVCWNVSQMSHARLEPPVPAFAPGPTRSERPVRGAGPRSSGTDAGCCRALPPPEPRPAPPRRDAARAAPARRRSTPAPAASELRDDVCGRPLELLRTLLRAASWQGDDERLALPVWTRTTDPVNHARAPEANLGATGMGARRRHAYGAAAQGRVATRGSCALMPADVGSAEGGERRGSTRTTRNRELNGTSKRPWKRPCPLAKASTLMGPPPSQAC